ncbi:hypothetical protein MCOR25_009736 [Pyricularia grisea]|nr:hypothetical protein MCOR25_009736 [Pyricularia grisea]
MHPREIDWCSSQSKPWSNAYTSLLATGGPRYRGRIPFVAFLSEPGPTTVHISRANDHGPVAHFFTPGTSESGQTNTFAIIKSWLHQLVSQSSSALQVALSFSELQETPRASSEDTVRLLRLVLQKLKGCTLITDGLDEGMWPLPNATSRADDRDRDSVVGLFSTIAEIASETSTRVLLHFNDPSDVGSDPLAFSKNMVENKLPNKTKEEQADFAEKIHVKSDGMFLWTKMMERNLSEDLTVPDDVDQDRGFVEELDEDSLPDSIDDMYIQSGIVELCGSLVEVRPLQVLDISNASRS